MSVFWPKGGLPGILHHYTETLTAFEYTSPKTTHKPHSILFLGGLGDGLATTSYTHDLIRALEPTPWSFFTLNLTASYNQWGVGHLDRDTNELATCLRYIQDYKSSIYGKDLGKIVLMGHSTGSQAVLHYLHRPNPHLSVSAFDSDLVHEVRPALDGAIMQAPISDREALKWVMEEGIGSITPAEAQAAYAKIETIAKDAAREEHTYDTIVPLALTTRFGYGANLPISIRRMMSLMSPESPANPSEDDLFSSDLSDEHLKTTFGKITERGLLKGTLMILYSGSDQAVPSWVDKEGLLARWRKAADEDGKKVWDEKWSAVVPGASHALSNDDQAEPRSFLAQRVLGYLGEIAGQ